MKRINDSILQPGDIILTTSRAKVSKGIRLATWSDISHAMVCVEGYSVIDATSDGVHARNTQRLFYAANDAVHVLRLRRAFTKQELNAVVMYMRGHIGSQYTTKEAVLTGLGRFIEPSKKQFCSRLVAQAFRSAGIELVPNADFCSPESLKKSALLVEISEPTEDVTDEDVRRWEDRPDGTQKTRDATNAILNGARTRNPSIQTFDDVDAHLALHPEDDDFFCGLLERSGYLSLWRGEQQKNPWLYDLALMQASPPDNMKAYCQSTLADEAGLTNRFIVNRGGYVLYAHQYGLRYFQLKLALYELLSSLHLQRIKVATAWLTAHGLAVPPSTPRLVPHTPEWFASMQPWDPIKAMMAEAAVQVAKHPSVCSICGDDPASDYVLKDEHRTLGGPGTLRLCEFCHEVQDGGNDLFVPL
ncbi:YiiX/YebB-like N1pC/P60 family cysteine hydrolase [Rhizobium sp. PP-CC-3G-465]|uniref:YiiX/YebB-like N1pC/P60 family cysteine hydrolase n=1 Tax=Rhizobium sp. PP-CC-3G-465 TaxID=2135648 RepID=UPI0010DD5EB9|nr:permuted papain-like amidase YaeF/Yiix C92 family enzyme [Rhizobium sp. PP-CC-3G-465]